MASIYIEDRGMKSALSAIEDAGHDWIRVRTDGLLVEISGEAPDEIERIRGLATIQPLFSNSRIRDRTTTTQTSRRSYFNLQLVWAGERVLMLGRLPDDNSRSVARDLISLTYPAATIEDLASNAAGEADQHWSDLLLLGLRGFQLVPGSNVFLADRQVTVIGQAGSQEELDRAREMLESARRDPLQLDLQVTFPRPTIGIFRFSMQLDEGRALVRDCHVETEGDRDLVHSAVSGGTSNLVGRCQLARGTPPVNWTEAVRGAVALLQATGSGSVLIEDTAIFAGPSDAGSQSGFNETARNLTAGIPDGYNLTLVGPQYFDVSSPAQQRVPVFVAGLDENGTLRMRGNLNNPSSQLAVIAFARAVFDPVMEDVIIGVDEAVSDLLTQGVISGLEALSGLHEGELLIGNDFIELSGLSGVAGRGRAISRQLAGLPDWLERSIEVIYDPGLSFRGSGMNPRRCISLAKDIMVTHRISFEPNSARLTADSLPAIGQLATVLRECTDAPLEISGHTDNQGSERMNMNLSRRRAIAVLNALTNEDLLLNNYTVTGYGESQPIADNSTAAGREQNRRIEFRLRDDAFGSSPR